MKRLIILITITISVISLSKAQSKVEINMEDLHDEIFSELSNLPAILNEIHFDWDDINNSLVDIDDISNSIEISGLENAVNLGKLNLATLKTNSMQGGIDNIASDSNNSNAYTYAYVTNEATNKGISTYSTTESPQNTDVFNQLSKIKGVGVVYISSAMLGMMPSMDMPGVDIGNIAGKLESLEIYTAEDNATKSLITISDKLINSGAYETLMLVKDGDSRTGFYMKKGTTNKGAEMLMITDDGTDATLIRFLGNFTMQDIKNVANQGKNIRTNTTTSNRMNEAELEMRIKEAQKRNDEAQKIANEAQKRAIEAQKRADERVKRAEERIRRAEEKARKNN